MLGSRNAAALLFAFCLLPATAVHAQVPPPAPASPPPASPAPAPSASASAQPAATPTQPPIGVEPAAAQVPVGSTATIHLTSVLGTITLRVADTAIADAVVDQPSQTVTISGKAPGATSIVVTDQRGLSATIPVRVAFNAGSIADAASIRITGDPASAAFVRTTAAEVAGQLAQPRQGAQVVVSTDQISLSQPLAQDDVTQVNVPVLLQGEQYFTVEGTTHVRVENLAAPKIVPSFLMVSDYPERLEQNGELFSSDIQRAQPSRFLYFHYNPPGEPDRRIVLRAENHSIEPAIVQFISGAGGPGVNEMAVGHDATRRFLTHLVQNEGRIVVIPGNSSVNVVEQPMPAKAIVCNVLQLRVLNGSTVHLTLFAQNASDSPDEALANATLLEGGHPHARGVYDIPEFHYSRLWNVQDPYLELSVGHIPLPNKLNGLALSGDYGVLQSFVIKVQNPTGQPQPIAIYENPRGGRATGTYLIDGTLIQSHQVPPFSRYKVRQYVVPARGFVRVTIQTIPDSGSSYPLHLEFAPDDGSVAPGAPGSPIY